MQFCTSLANDIGTNHMVNQRDRGVQLSHCRTRVRQGPHNVRQNKNSKHCSTGKFFVKHDLLGLTDVSFELFLVQIVFKKQ